MTGRVSVRLPSELLLFRRVLDECCYRKLGQARRQEQRRYISMRAYLELYPNGKALVLRHRRHLDVRKKVLALKHPPLLYGLRIVPDHPIDHDIMLLPQIIGKLPQPLRYLVDCPVKLLRRLLLPRRRLHGRAGSSGSGTAGSRVAGRTARPLLIGRVRFITGAHDRGRRSRLG